MSCTYSIEGTMIVRESNEMDEILARLESELGEIQLFVDETEEGKCVVEIDGTTHCSYARVEVIDGILKELVEHLVEPTTLWTECDGERTPFFLGNEEDANKLYRAYLMDEAREAAKKLTKEEAVALFKEILGV